MTLILATLDPDGTAHMLGDRAVRIGGYSQRLAYPKVTQPLPSLLIGAAGSTAWLEAVQAWAVPSYLLRDYTGIALLRMVALELAQRGPKGATCQAILATAGALYPFTLLEDRAVASSPSADRCCAVGSGALAGLAALKALGTLETAPTRLLVAGTVTADLLPGDVASPFDVISTPPRAETQVAA